MKKIVWLICMLIVENSIAKDNFCLDIRNKYYLESDSVSIKDTKLTVLTPKFQMDNDLQKKKGCINRLLIIEKNNKVTINNKAILNNIDYQSDPFVGIKKDKDSISLAFEYGSINFLHFIYNFKMINGHFKLDYKKYSFFNKRNSEIYIDGVKFFKDKNISLERFNAFDYIEQPSIPLTLDDVIKVIKRAEYLYYYDIGFFKSFLYVNPLISKNLTSYNNIAYYLQKAGSNEEAVYLLEQITEKFRKRTVAHYNLGDAYWALGQKKKAKEAYTTYIELMCDAGKQKRIPKVVMDRVSNK